MLFMLLPLQIMAENSRDFKKESNARKRRAMLTASFKVQKSPASKTQIKASRSVSPSDEEMAMLELGLRDANPVVAEKAIELIGSRRLTDMEPKIVKLYTSARKQYGGYAERIRIAILSSLWNTRELLIKNTDWQSPYRPYQFL